MLLTQNQLDLAVTSGIKKVRTKETIPTEQSTFRRRQAHKEMRGH